jgi:DNA repair exonuclease SbcCD ATPase subunit
MKTIELKNIELVNFKGIKSLSIDFEHNTDIFGANEGGKTTIFDAITWVLFGKDSQDKKDFEVKTLDEHNNVIEKLDHEVIATFLIDGEMVVLRKILTEKWTKKKGSAKPEFTGNTIEHYWNGVPLGTAREYQEKVNLICDEGVFKLITNPASFMALKWQDRREVLVKIADSQPDEALAKGNRDFEKLFGKLSNNKTLEEYSKEIQASIKKAKDDLKAIPTRIDEVVRGKAEGLDFKQIALILETKTEELAEIDLAIQNKAGMYDTEIAKNNEVKGKINLLKNWVEMNESVVKGKAKQQITEQNGALLEVQKKIDANLTEIKTAENGVTTLTSKVQLIGAELIETNLKVAKKREEWYAENAKTLTFDNECFDCPTCKRAFEATDIEAKKAKMQADFIAGKKAELAKITTSATGLKTIVDNQQKEIDGLNVRITNGNKHIETLKEANKKLESELVDLQQNTVILNETDVFNALIETDTTHRAKKAEIVELEATIVEIPAVNFSEYTEKKKVLTLEIAELNRKLHLKEAIKLADDRIKKLQAEETILSQQILDVERTQFIIDNFNKVKIEALENSINSKLKYVKFKMFDQQINGGEVPCCEALLNGVPYSSNVNTAGRLKVGLDIINMLCEYYQVNAPIVIDNRESVTNIIPCQSQIINLVVSPEDKVLRIVPQPVFFEGIA